MNAPAPEAMPAVFEAAMQLAGNAVLDQFEPHLNAARREFKKIDAERWAGELLLEHGPTAEGEVIPLDLLVQLIDNAQIVVEVTW